MKLHAGRGLQPRPERFDAAAIFEPYQKPCGRGKMPRPALEAKIIIFPIVNTPNKISNTEAFIKQFAGAIFDFPEVDAEGLPEERGF